MFTPPPSPESYMPSNSDPKWHSDIAERITSLESDSRALSAGQHELSSSFQTFASDMRGAIQTLQERLTASQRTPWSTLASWAAVVITIIALGGAGFVRDVSRIETTQAIIRGDVEARSAWIGQASASLERLHQDQVALAGAHADVPVIAERVLRIDSQVAHLDEMLQREMRILDQTAATGLEALDRRLQQEMRLLNEPLSVAIADIREELRGLRQAAERTDQTSFTRADWQAEQAHILQRIRDITPAK